MFLGQPFSSLLLLLFAILEHLHITAVKWSLHYTCLERERERGLFSWSAREGGGNWNTYWLGIDLTHWQQQAWQKRQLMEQREDTIGANLSTTGTKEALLWKWQMGNKLPFWWDCQQHHVLGSNSRKEKQQIERPATSSGNHRPKNSLQKKQAVFCGLENKRS